ncbi:MAG TPA: EI24 domain-containing protein [Polyangiaceae bacterium]|jgi:CysZ protein|nr:EI24 domain-containing protein [Polyangiaceae bacterium]
MLPSRDFVHGLFDGFLSVFRGIAFIGRTRRAWLPSAVPAILLVALTVAGLFVAIHWVAPALMARVPFPDSTFGHFGGAVVRVVVVVLTGGAGALLAATFAPTLSGPALERIIHLREESLGLPRRAPVSVFTELWCGLRAQCVASVVGGPLLAASWLVTLAFPPAAVVTFPLKVLVALALLVWTLLDYPLSLRGMRLRERLALMKREAPRVIGFGAGVGVLFALPLGAILLLPAAVAAATEIGYGSRERGFGG